MGSLGLRVAEQAPRRTAHEYVLASLRSAILGGDLPGGARLVQADIARELGVSTTPVREALRDLATEGLVHLDAHRGSIVKRLSYDDLLEIHELTRILEAEAMRKLAPVVDQDLITHARELAEVMARETDSAGWADLNRQFHATISQAAPSTRLRAILRSLRDSAAPYVALATRERGQKQFEMANEQHIQILDALEARDADRSAELAAKHVDLTLWALREARHMFESEPEEKS